MVELGKIQQSPAIVDTPAARLHALLARADSLTLHTPHHRAELFARHAVTEAGGLRLTLPAAAGLARHLVDVGEVPARVEFAELGTGRTGDRVRARAALLGWLTPDALHDDDLVAYLDLASADLVDPDGTEEVDPDEFRAAAVCPPDPSGHCCT
ncbi:hypothetical protein [Micromonospora sp. SH-82]|uniref:hypothetical protein n=1 Tax=Micromonospora sp. SH-82 TaxID=3132938 RepID=UPI003EC06226